MSIEGDLLIQHFTIGGEGLFRVTFGSEGRNAYQARSLVYIAGGSLTGNLLGRHRTGVIALREDSKIQMCGELYDAEIKFTSIQADRLVLTLRVRPGSYGAGRGVKCAWMDIPPLR
jgi:hypothetical protein